MSSKFAKLYETEKYGQLLVKLDTDVGGEPEVCFYFEPKGLGVCSYALRYPNDWDAAETAFEGLNEAQAIAIVSQFGFMMSEPVT